MHWIGVGLPFTFWGFLLSMFDGTLLNLVQVQGHMSALRTLPHSAAITTVDWHPSLPIFLTGSADHSVRVTSLS